MENKIKEQLTALNQIYKEFDQFYHNYAKEFALSDASFWVLYSLLEYGDHYPQRDLCEDWSYSPQTANSALKSLEKQGYIELRFESGNRKSKEVHFTQKGKELAEKVVAPLMEAEHRAFSQLEEQERDIYLAASQKHLMLIRQETQRIERCDLPAKKEGEPTI